MFAKARYTTRSNECYDAIITPNCIISTIEYLWQMYVKLISKNLIDWSLPHWKWKENENKNKAESIISLYSRLETFAFSIFSNLDKKYQNVNYDFKHVYVCTQSEHYPLFSLFTTLIGILDVSWTHCFRKQTSLPSIHLSRSKCN